jgi:hypothetical protein
MLIRDLPIRSNTYKVDGNLEGHKVYRADIAVHEQKYFDGDNAEVETDFSIID